VLGFGDKQFSIQRRRSIVIRQTTDYTHRYASKSPIYTANRETFAVVIAHARHKTFHNNDVIRHHLSQQQLRCAAKHHTDKHL
jgi:hypothetical protein